jgi:hypothetical protein
MMAMSGSSQPGGSESGKPARMVWAAACWICVQLISPGSAVVWKSWRTVAVAPTTTSLPRTSLGSTSPLRTSAKGRIVILSGGAQ